MSDTRLRGLAANLPPDLGAAHAAASNHLLVGAVIEAAAGEQGIEVLGSRGVYELIAKVIDYRQQGRLRPRADYWTRCCPS